MSEIFAAVCSIAPTKRRRFLWAAWWSGPPVREPFKKPDASSGGARSREEALREAERAAGRPLVETDARWARAWARILAGEKPWTGHDARGTRAGAPPSSRGAAHSESIWSILGVTPQATVEEIKSAYRRRARETHPDHGGDAERFRRVRHACEQALARRSRGRKRAP